MAVPAALTRAHIAAQARLRAVVSAAAAAAWRRLPSYDEENVEPFLAAAVPLVLAAQAHSVSLTDAYLARAVGRGPLGVARDALIGANVRNGARPEVVYRRPFVTVWSRLGEGVEWDRAIDQGLHRLTATAEMDVQLAHRAAAREIGTRDERIYGFRRVTNPGACELCLIASTQRYHRADLMPIHHRCGCGTEPITDPAGRVVDRDLLRELKADGALERITRQRRNARAREQGRAIDDAAPLPTVAVREHGELGPVLTNAAHDFALH